LTPHVAWRVSFVTVPFIIVMTMAIAILLLCPDTPTGAWKDRYLSQNVVEGVEIMSDSGNVDEKTKKVDNPEVKASSDIENSQLPEYDRQDFEFAEAALIKKPSAMDVFKVLWSLPTIMQCTMYFVTFGAELSINSNLSSFYIKSSGTPPWPQTLAANWAAMYGLLNVVTRPLGGYIADSLYPVAGIEGKKFWMITCTFPYIRNV
jgi:NNP family nitrate/nitrite transporter-like MFS transporter